MKRSDAFDKTDNAVLVIDENSVNGKTHKKHVDGSAVCNNKRFIGEDLLASQKSFHARPECISRGGVPGNNRIFAFIENFHARKGGRSSGNDCTASTLSVKFSNVAYLKDRGSNIRKHV